MSAPLLLVGICAVLGSAGLVGVAAALAGVEARPGRDVVAAVERLAASADRLALRVTLALGGALLILLLTGWPVGALWAGVLGAVTPSLLEARRQRTAGVARLEAIATWTATVRGLNATGIGLREALIASADVAPAPIRAEIEGLAARLRQPHRFGTIDVLRALQDQLGDQTGDSVALSLALASKRPSGRLGAELASLERGARRLAEMRKEIDADRQKERETIRGTALVSVVSIPVLSWIAPELFRPATTAAGQLALGVTGAVYAAGLWWMARMEHFEIPERIRITETGGLAK